MDAISVAVVVMAGGYVVNGALDRVRRIRKDRREEQERALSGPEPVCGCGHHLAYHDLHDGRCYAERNRKDSGDGKDATAPVQCTCRRYAGPEPLATLYAPPLNSGASTEPRPELPEA